MNKNRRLFQLLLSFALFCVSFAAFASDSLLDTATVFPNNANDYSIKYLNMLFGNVSGTLNGGLTGQTVGHLFFIFNQGILIASGVWILFTLFRIVGKMLDGTQVQEATKEGKTFLSIVLGVVLVIPSPSTGYSTIQNVVMKVVVQGVHLANGIWNYQIDQFAKHKHVFDNPPEMQAWNPSGSSDSTLDYARLWWQGGTSPDGTMQNEGKIPAKFKALVQKMISAEYSYYYSHIYINEASPSGRDSLWFPTMLARDTPDAPLSIEDYAVNVCAKVGLGNPTEKPVCSDKSKVTFDVKFSAFWTSSATDAALKLKFVGQAGPTIQNQLYYTAQKLQPIAKVYACDAYIRGSASSKTPKLCEGVPTLNDDYLTTVSAQVISIYSSFATVMNGVTANYKMLHYRTQDSADSSSASTSKACMAPSEEAVATDSALYQNLLDNTDDIAKLRLLCSTGGYANVLDCAQRAAASGDIQDIFSSLCGVNGGALTAASPCLKTLSDAFTQMGVNEKQADALNNEAKNPGACSKAYSITMNAGFDSNSGGEVGYESGDAALAIYNRTKSYINDAVRTCQSYPDTYKVPFNCADITAANNQMSRGGLTSWAIWCSAKLGQNNQPYENLICSAITSPRFFTCASNPQTPPCTSGDQCWKSVLRPYSSYSKGKTCTQALADQMRSKGWIMAGAYYWLIAHQDQLSATNSKFSEAHKDDYLYWSPAKRLDAALAYTTVESGTPTMDCQQSPSGDGNHECPPWITTYWTGHGNPPSAGPPVSYLGQQPVSSSGVGTATGLGEKVLNDLLAQFKDSGGGIGVIDINTGDYAGISSQLSIAAKGIKSFIQGNSNFLQESGMRPKEGNDSDLSKIGGSADSVRNPSNGSVSGDATLFASSLFSAQSHLFPQMLNQINYLEKFILNVSDQLNNPNMDPQALLASVGIGMVYQGFYAYLGYLQMMIQLIVMLLIIAVLTIVLLVSVFGAPLACMGAVEAGLMISYVKTIAGLLKKLGMALITMGLVMAFYLPLYPWIIFSFAVIGWFIAVIEAMAAAPLICLGMTNPQGHELAGSLKQAMMLLLSIFIRPALMIISFILSMIAVRVMLFFVIQGFIIVVGTVFNSNPSDYCHYVFTNDPSGSQNTGGTSACSGTSGNGFYPTNLWSSIFGFSSHAADIGTHQYASTLNRAQLTPGTEGNYATDIGSPVTGQDLFDTRPPAVSKNGGAIGYQPIFQFLMVLFSAPILLGLLTYMAYKVITHAYSLVFLIPEGVIKWIGGQSAGSTSALQQSAEGAKGATEQSGQTASKGMSEMGKASEAGAKSGASSAASLGTKSAGSVMSMSQSQSGGDED